MDLLNLAKDVADRIEAQSVRAKVPVAISIVDIHGNIILEHRMNGAAAFAIEISQRKAYTSALIGVRTGDLFSLVQPGNELFHLMGLSGGRFCAMGGGAPLASGGERVAGVGVSGGTVEQDVDILESSRCLTGEPVAHYMSFAEFRSAYLARPLEDAAQCRAVFAGTAGVRRLMGDRHLAEAQMKPSGHCVGD